MPTVSAAADNAFGILPNNGEEEILNQIQQLLTLTLQNQSAINRIVSVLEKQGTNISLPAHSASSSPFNNNSDHIEDTTPINKGKARLSSSNKDVGNPFEE